MTKRITADHVKLKRAYEPATADDGTRVLIDRLWPRGSNESNFNRPLKANCQMDGIGIFRLIPPTKRAWPLALPREGHECCCASIVGTDWKFSGFAPIDPYRSFRAGRLRARRSDRRRQTRRGGRCLEQRRPQSLFRFRCTRTRHGAILNGLTLGN